MARTMARTKNEKKPFASKKSGDFLLSLS